MSKKIILKDRAVSPDPFLSEDANGLHVRAATESDINGLMDIETAAFDPALYNSLATKKSLRHLLRKGNALILLAEKGDRLAGYALVMFRKTSNKARFYSLAVHPDFQGQGVGSILFQAIEALCGSIGAEALLLEIREDNHVLKNRYEKKGYTPYKIVPDYYADGAAAIKMQRLFSAP